MSGHSKWSSIKHQKGAADKRRSNLFTKLAKTIAVAARGGGDPAMNFQLRLAIEKAKAANMPKDNIARAIKRGTGELGGAQIEEILYEIYGPSGTAILVEVLTDNKNRASAEIKAVLNKMGGKLAGSGVVSYLFERKGEIRISYQLSAVSGQQNSEEKIEEVIINSGADDYEEIPVSLLESESRSRRPAGRDKGFLVYCHPENLAAVKNALQKSSLKIESAELVWAPKTPVAVSEEEAQKVIKLLEALDELDDISSVSSNLG